jgi:hypothetical protein
MSGYKRKIAVLATVASMALFTLVYGFAFPADALAWDNCPKGLVNDPYPGACRRYVDTNGDNICDLSQSKPEDTTTTTAAAVTTTTSGEPPTGDCPLGPCVGCGACFSIGVTASANSSDASPATLAAVGGGAAVVDSGSATDTTSTTTPTSGDATAASSYDATLPADGSTAVPAAVATAAMVAADTGGSSFITHYLVSPIALGFFIIYGVSFFLYRTKRIRIATHRKIWNVLLLGTFLVTGVFGLILAIQLDYPLPFTIHIDLLFWHVDAGIAMTLVSLFHMGWHFNYYKNLVRNTRAKARAVRAAEREFEADDRQAVLEAREQRRVERDARRAARGGAGTRGSGRPPASEAPGVPAWVE